MTVEAKNNLGRILKQQRLMIPLTLHELATVAGVSASHIGRIERGERHPSGHILRRIARPLRFDETELLRLAGYLSPERATETEPSLGGQLDPYVAAVLSAESLEMQRALVAILNVLKCVAKAVK